MKKNLIYILFSLSLIFLCLGNVSAAGSCISCGADTLPIPEGIPNFISKLITLVQIMVPVVLIVVGMVKYLKVVTSGGDDKYIKETNASFIRSLVTGAAIFLVVAVVKFAFSLLGSDGESTLGCVSCFISGDNCYQTACLDRGELPKSYACYVCSDDDSIRLWTMSNPEKTSACPSGYTAKNYSKDECYEVNEACYKCNTSSDYVWTYSAPGYDYNNYMCPAGWTKQENKTEETCTAKCWQCGNGEYVWGITADASSYCSVKGSYHGTSISKKSDCHN